MSSACTPNEAVILGRYMEPIEPPSGGYLSSPFFLGLIG
eukprot:COSAG03_NODE_22849_length_286_cov_0.818182_1_plen_38_part_01